jgi:hypothetical protein
LANAPRYLWIVLGAVARLAAAGGDPILGEPEPAEVVADVRGAR